MFVVTFCSVNEIRYYVMLYPPPFQVTICRPPQLSQGTVGGPFPVPIIGDDFESVCFEDTCAYVDKDSFGCGI